MRRACFDTQVLIYWLESDAPLELKKKAQSLFNYLDDQNWEKVLPAPVLGEFLIKVDHEKRRQAIMDLSEVFIILPYDVEAALINARLWNEKEDIVRQMIKNKEASRQTIKVDLQVISIAIASNCDVLYTNESRIRNLAGKEIKVQLIEELRLAEQKNLFRK